MTASNPIPIVKELMELYRVRRKKQVKIALYPRPEQRGFTASLDKVARAICHGQQGEIRKRYREGQENQLGALGLVISSVRLIDSAARL